MWICGGRKHVQQGSDINVTVQNMRVNEKRIRVLHASRPLDSFDCTSEESWFTETFIYDSTVFKYSVSIIDSSQLEVNTILETCHSGANLFITGAYIRRTTSCFACIQWLTGWLLFQLWFMYNSQIVINVADIISWVIKKAKYLDYLWGLCKRGLQAAQTGWS